MEALNFRVSVLQVLQQLNGCLLSLLALLFHLEKVVSANLEVILVLILGAAQLLECILHLDDLRLQVLLAAEDLLHSIDLAVQLKVLIREGLDDNILIALLVEKLV